MGAFQAKCWAILQRLRKFFLFLFVCSVRLLTYISSFFLLLFSFPSDSCNRSSFFLNLFTYFTAISLDFFFLYFAYLSLCFICTFEFIILLSLFLSFVCHDVVLPLFFNYFLVFISLFVFLHLFYFAAFVCLLLCAPVYFLSLYILSVFLCFNSFLHSFSCFFIFFVAFVSFT